MHEETRADLDDWVRPPVVLASASPRRQAFLAELGLDFVAVPADVDETPQPGEHPVALAARLAEIKARSVAERLGPGPRRVIVAADTVVALGDLLLGKPEDDADAWRMLDLLRDGPHQVHSAVSVLDTGDGSVRTQVNSTTVVMRPYTDAEIDAYIAGGDPMDKAGAYAIQHPGFAPAAAVAGCLSGVMGLPLGALADLLREVGIDLPPVAPVCQRQTSFRCCRAGE
ncbi:MAG: septum formation protein Maf [Caldilineaceae bacterium]|nr:septum formation protein Maf [Caldilineaceae bacterium]